MYTVDAYGYSVLSVNNPREEETISVMTLSSHLYKNEFKFIYGGLFVIFKNIMLSS